MTSFHSSWKRLSGRVAKLDSIFTASPRQYVYRRLSVHSGGVPDQVPPGADTPPPTNRYTPGTRYTPQHRACWEIRSTRGRYASYWNAILLTLQILITDVPEREGALGEVDGGVGGERSVTVSGQDRTHVVLRHRRLRRVRLVPCK